MNFYGNFLYADGIGACFEAAPALKHVEDVDLSWPGDSGIDNHPEDFLQNFVAVDVPSQGIRARELRRIEVFGSGSGPTGSMHDSVKELVRNIVTLPHLQDGRPLELDFSKNHFPGAFGLQIIELLRGTAREVTFRMGTHHDDGELVRTTVGASIGYSVDSGNFITRYAPDGSGIKVNVKEPLNAAGQDPCWVTIRRAADVPRKKPRNE